MGEQGEQLQRSVTSFRRQGSSGSVWDDKFLAGLWDQSQNQKQQDEQSQPQLGLKANQVASRWSVVDQEEGQDSINVGRSPWRRHPMTLPPLRYQPVAFVDSLLNPIIILRSRNAGDISFFFLS
ncbi:hypothetical protein HN51_003034 [Arachis hypogaea]|nr:uncharacterized protein DS421_1g30000 [Arachis hypogaea]